MKYGTSVVPGCILITERDEISVSGLAKTLHLLWMIDIVDHVWGGELNCLVFCTSLLNDIDRSVNLSLDFTLVYSGFL